MDTYVLLSTSTGFTRLDPVASISASAYVPVYFTNWNDDKCTDFVSANTLYVSACNGAAAESYPITGTLVAALDWDGDGRTDLMVANGSTLGVYLSKATGAPTLTATTIPYSSTCQYVWMNATGNGLDDLGCWSGTGSNPLTYYLPQWYFGSSYFVCGWLWEFSQPQLCAYLAEQLYRYPSSSLAPTFPDISYIGPMYVVSEVLFSDPSSSGATYNQTFHYYAAWTNLQGRG